MSKHIPRSPDTLPYPILTLEEMLVFDGYLAYFESAANTAFQKMRQIPKAERVEWYDKNVLYWKNVRSGFKHARGVLRNSRKANAAQSSSGPESLDTLVPERRDAKTMEFSG